MTSLQPYLSIAIVLGILLLFSAMMRNMVANANPQQRLGAIASALGLQLIEGDPDLNIVLGPRQSFLLAMFGVTSYAIRARAIGQLGVHPCTFELHEKVFRLRLRRVTVHEKSEYHAELALQQAFSPFPFEAWRPSQYGDGPTSRCGFPVVSQGPSTNGSWLLSSPSPHAAQWLGPTIHYLAQHIGHLHLVQSEGRLVIPFTRTGLAVSCSQLSALRDELLRIASMMGRSQTHQPQPPQAMWPGAAR